MRSLRSLLLMFAFTAGCASDKPAGDSGSTAGDGAEGGDGGGGDGGGDVTLGLPEGTSTWAGTVEAAGVTLEVEVRLENTGGDLIGELAIVGDASPVGTGAYTLSGTHAPASGLVAVAPDAWLVPTSPVVELSGFYGTYDPVSRTLTGQLRDYAAGGENRLDGGPVSLTLTSGDGSPSAVGDGAKGLAAGDHAFTGQLQCTGGVREGAGTLTYDGAGGLTGTVSYGDLTLEEATATFEVVGVHNPTTGGITLAPGLYVSEEFNFLTFFVDATHDPATGAFVGDTRTNERPCPDGLWQMTF